MGPARIPHFPTATQRLTGEKKGKKARQHNGNRHFHVIDCNGIPYLITDNDVEHEEMNLTKHSREEREREQGKTVDDKFE